MALDLFGRADPLGSTLLDRVHKGTRQAGNKSSLAFRNDIGIPGYTGYIPTSNCVPVDIKGGNRHEGKVPTTGQTSHLARTLPGTSAHCSVYRATFKGDTGDGPGSLRAGGGYWINTRSKGPKVPLSALTTYRAEILRHDEKERLLRTTLGATSTTSDYAVGRREGERAQVTDLGRSLTGALDVSTPQTGYVTSYGSMVVKNPLVGGSAAAGKPLTAPAAPEGRPKVAPRGIPAPFDGLTTYKRCHGDYLEDPVARLPEGKADFTARGSTAELSFGTTRGTRHIPGYAGHVAAHPSNPAGDAPRTYAKEDMCKGPALDQYLRGHLPGYGGFRPQAPGNIKLGTDDASLRHTTQGAAALSVQALPAPRPDKHNFISSNTGTMSFFTGGGMFVSENGKSNAQQYFIQLRPLEGTPGLYVPSKTTAAGYRFNK